MADYATVEDLVAGWPAAFTTGRAAHELRALISRAGNLIDAYLAKRYPVPFDATPNAPPLIKDIAVDLAFLDQANRQPTTSDFVRDRVEDAKTKLTMLATGELVVVDAAGALVATRTDIGTIRSTTGNYVPVFGAVPSLSEQDDPDRADDESDARD